MSCKLAEGSICRAGRSGANIAMGEGYREGSEEWRMAMRNDFQDNPGVIAPPPLIYAGVLVVGLLLRLIFPTRFLPRPIVLIIGTGCIAVACILAPTAFHQMRHAKTNVAPTQPAIAFVTLTQDSRIIRESNH